MVDAYLSVGSNLGNRLENLLNSLQKLTLQPKILLQRVSSIYETEPVGVVDQPMFLNAVCKLKTSLAPKQLLAEIKKIEADAGRKKTGRWQERIIDIDILLYGNVVICDSELEIPHPRMRVRRFVLVPFAEISPDYVLPDNEVLPISEILEKCPDKSSVQIFLEYNKLTQINDWGTM